MAADQIFRPAKRRKIYRKRRDEDDSESNTTKQLHQPESTAPLTLDELIITHGEATLKPEVQQGNDTLSATGLLRLRKAGQRKRGGVEFSNSNSIGQNISLSSQIKDLHPENDDAITSIEKVVNRFAPQTGLVADVDKHMYVSLPFLWLVVWIQRLTL